jgi:hypothetical protein
MAVHSFVFQLFPGAIPREGKGVPCAKFTIPGFKTQILAAPPVAEICVPYWQSRFSLATGTSIGRPYPQTRCDLRRISRPENPDQPDRNSFS